MTKHRYYKLKHTFGLREKEVKISLEDLKYMNQKIKKDKNIAGFIFGLEEVKNG